ncbi:hypothetical protein NPIL_175041 [Nephila pilipes]|uniref:Uncharacterized protein n=1 Tax=Nephila pilipes TaxID=299642 RepID=A0A8X6SZS7_NEPPI|nr:hypothetical protein NPIL_175041 [Nephila pilipes]
MKNVFWNVPIEVFVCILSLPNSLDCPVETLQDLALQHFEDNVWDPETPKALRLADVKDIESALVYDNKIEAAQ